MAADRVLTWEVEGHKVTCHESRGDRLWHCTCADFARRLTEQRQGYWKHTAFCMMHAYAAPRVLSISGVRWGRSANRIPQRERPPRDGQSKCWVAVN